MVNKKRGKNKRYSNIILMGKHSIAQQKKFDFHIPSIHEVINDEQIKKYNTIEKEIQTLKEINILKSKIIMLRKNIKLLKEYL
jgi:hypothetical protein